jgi:Na+/proline symporter
MVMTSLGILAAMSPELGESISALPEVAREDAVLMTFVRGQLPSLFSALLLVVLVSIIMSSLDSLLNAGAVAFTRDIARRVLTTSDEDRDLVVGRCATVFIAVGAGIGALFVPGILVGLRICYSIWAPSMLPALILGLWLLRPRPLAGILSMVTGTLVAVVFEFVIPRVMPSWSQVPGILPALGAAFIAYGIGAVMGKAQGGRS